MALAIAEYSRLGALEIAKLLRGKELCAAEVMGAAIAACDQLNPELNAVLEVYDDARALSSAYAGGAFGGVPYLRKDIGATEAGRLSEMGSRLMAGHRAEEDSYFTLMAKTAGLQCFGRTTCPEFAMSSATESIHSGITRNPWNLARMAGGSSGGAAAAVASGIVPIAHASDGGGSIRIPASACGIVGLKPSRGRVSLGPSMGEALFGLGSEFVVTRNVADAAAALDVFSKYWPGDPFQIAASGQPYLHAIMARSGPLKIAFTASPWSCNPVAADIAEAVRNTAQMLAQMGHHVEEAAPQFDFEQMIHVLTICFLDGMTNLKDIETHGGPGPETLEAITLAAYELACQLSFHDISVMQAHANTLRRDVGKFFAEYDMLLTPTLSQTPPAHGEYSQNHAGMSPFEFQAMLQKTDQFLPIFNITGQPAITLPIGLDQHGMPMGVQLVGRVGREDQLLQVAKGLEAAIGWAKSPPIHAGKKVQA